MKFAKYLQKTETSEWKNAYIDYRGLKKLINHVKISREFLDGVHSSDSGVSVQYSPSTAQPCPSEVDSRIHERSLGRPELPFELPPFNFSLMNLPIEPLRGPSLVHIISAPIPSMDKRAQNPSMQTGSFDIGSAELAVNQLQNDLNKTQRFTTPLAELPLHEIVTQFTPQESAFFAMLDAQLDKVESFYLAREKEMVTRGVLLLNQLEELKENRKMFLEAGTTKKPWAAAFLSALSSRIRLQMGPTGKKEGKLFKMTPKAVGGRGSIQSQSSDCSLAKDKNPFYMATLTDLNGKQKDPEEGGRSAQRHREEDEWNSRVERPHSTTNDDPAGYIRAKRELKRAVLEHYRGLETLYNYQVLNVIGFRKAVKKFEKITRISIQNQYMTEKVDTCAFASGETVRNMTREMEYMYASEFAGGDKKKALERLRASTTPSSHHSSTVRSGLLLGLAIPALIDGLIRVFQPETQQAIPRWDILLFLYGMILVPVLYSLLLGINLLVWAKSRINYTFIFDLDVSRHLDHRQYFEIPSLLLSTLCLTFWVSFSHISAPIVQPTTWPLLWLTFAALLMVDPMPIMARPSRYWLIKTILKLFMSGIRRVEFADFWMGDQLCSFIFTLSNTSLFICVYLGKFADDWQKCQNSSRTWPIAFVLASIPFVIRLVQCVKCYIDSQLILHLVNAGKYGTGILSYLFYFMWSYRQHRRGTIFALWCVFNTCYSIYACTWDLLADYSLLQPHSKHPFLRTELMYTPQWVYYLAMLSNLLIRFLWVIYIPERGPTMLVRTFITGMFEMLRRIQWNFYRLENEHIRNMNQYRVTREMPLPYAFEFGKRMVMITTP